MQGETRGLADRIIGGAAWVGIGRVGVRVISVASTVILARLLTPEDFGLVAVAMAFVGILAHMSSFGFNQALIRFQDAGHEEYSTAWTLDVVRGALLCVVLFSLSGPIAAFYDEQRLSAILSVVALIPLISGLENVRLVDFEKGLDFRPMSALMVAVKLISFLVTITVAILTRSYWALVVGTVTAQLVRVTASYWLLPYRPKLTVAAWRKLLGFSGWLLGANMLQAMTIRLDTPILQKLMATQAVGVFYLAHDLVITPMREITGPVRRVLFPGLMKISPESPAFGRAYFGAVSGLFMIVAPVGIGITLVADDAVIVILGSQWQDAVTPMRLFGVQIAVTVLGQVALSTVLASGRTRLWFTRSAIGLPIRVGLLVFGAVWWGLNGAVAGLLVASVIITYFDITMANRVIGSSLLDHLKPCWRSGLALAAMAIAVYGVSWVMGGDGSAGDLLGRAVRLSCMVLAGLFVYVMAHLGVWLLAKRPDGPESRIVQLLKDRGVVRRNRLA